MVRVEARFEKKTAAPVEMSSPDFELEGDTSRNGTQRRLR
jgi:hypothetical protein